MKEKSTEKERLQSLPIDEWLTEICFFKVQGSFSKQYVTADFSAMCFVQATARSLNLTKSLYFGVTLRAYLHKKYRY